MIPESGLVLPEGADAPSGDDESGDGSAGNDDFGADAIQESTGSSGDELPGKRGLGEPGALKKNLPLIIFGAAAVGFLGVMGFRMLGASDGAQPQVAQQQPAQVQAAAPAPAVVAAAAPIVPAPAPASSPEPVEVVMPPVAAPASASAMPSGTAPVAAAVAVAPMPPSGPTTPVVDDVYSTRGMNIPAAQLPAAALAQGSTNAANVAVCQPVAAAPACSPVVAAKSTAKKRTPRPVQDGSVELVKKSVEPAPRADGYEIHLGANGLAWITMPDGDKRVVAKGDRIEGLGVVQEVDTENHLIRVGRVTLR